MAHDITIAAYYFPNWHPCPRNDKVYGLGCSEWEIVRAARPRFPGHQQPKVHLWGYLNEATPEVSALQIAAAADHGVDAFIYDWYWGNEGPMLHKALEEGYLHASNRERIKFGIMWANHWPVTRTTFDQAVEHVVEAYFTRPSYWRIEGRPYFSVYELHTLVAGLGGVAATRTALEDLRAKTRQVGQELHLNAVEWGLHSLPPDIQVTRNQYIRMLGFDSVTSYVWVHNVRLPNFPDNPYPSVAQAAYADWERFAGEFSMPYHPNVTMGWDSWPRAKPEEEFKQGPYPRGPMIVGNTPLAFRQSLEQVRTFLTEHNPSQKVVTVNAWNEWTEGSYLEPDMVNGMGYLEAIREVFG